MNKGTVVHLEEMTLANIIPASLFWNIPGAGQNTADLLWVYNLVLHSEMLG